MNRPAGLPAPSPEERAHSDRLTAEIRAEMSRHGGALPFAQFMQWCLYRPRLGYYSSGRRKLGADGDFVTAPEISPIFARCLARQVRDLLEEIGGGEVFELGAGTGTMAADLLGELDQLATLPAGYRILEPSAELRDRQRRTLGAAIPHLMDRVRWLDRLPRSPFPGVVLANEVLDALPVTRFRKTRDGLRRLDVCWRDGGFAWRLADPPAALARAVAEVEQDLGHALPAGYESEICEPLGPLVAGLARCLERGALLLVDYGYRRAEYYHPERGEGTLVCHYRHRMHADPLVLPGLQDISASVDFSVVARAGEMAGLRLDGYTTQAWFLFGAGLAELFPEGPASDVRAGLERAGQIKRLTLPGEMGERFKAIALTRGVARPLRGFSLVDFSNRL